MSKRPKDIRRSRRSLAGKSKETSHKTKKPSLFQRWSSGQLKHKDKSKVPSQAISPWRLWLFRLVSVILGPVLFFGLLDVTLRVAGYGFPPSVFINCEVNDTESYRDNVKFAWQFFPRNISREFGSFVFPSDKLDNTYRIFILGGSAAYGTPEPAYGFWRILKVMLEDRYPDTNFEVIPTAMPAINSHVVLQIAKDCAQHEPDLFIAYLGNNEVVGPYGAGTIFSPVRGNLSLIRAEIAFKGTRLGQLLTNILESTGADQDTPDVWRGLEMFLDKQVSLDDPALKYVYEHFQSNLEDIICVVQKTKAKLILCTVGSNLKDCPPFASLHRPDITEAQERQWDDIYKEGVEYEEAMNYQQAIEQYLAAAAIDDRYADLQFRLGCCYWFLGEYDKARVRYIEARELDTLRFRSDNRINAIITDVAADKKAQGIYFSDTAESFEQNSPYDTPGEELFYEHVHLNFRGNYLLAKTIFEKIEEVLPEKIKLQGKDGQQLLSEVLCAQRLAYTDWDRYKIAAKLYNLCNEAPYSNQLYHRQRVMRMEENAKALKVNLTPDVLQKITAQYRSAIENNTKDWFLRLRFAIMLTEGLKEYRAAAEQYRLLLEHSNYYVVYNNLGNILGILGDFDEGIVHCIEAIRIKPTYSDAHYNLANIYKARSQIDKAVEHYYETLRFRPDYLPAYVGLIEIMQRQGQIDKAVELYRKTLAFIHAPDSSGVHYNIALLLIEQGRTDEAIMELRSSLEIDPNLTRSSEMLEALLKQSH